MLNNLLNKDYTEGVKLKLHGDHSVSPKPPKSKCEARNASLTLQETRSIHDSMSISKIEFISLMYHHYLNNISA